MGNIKVFGDNLSARGENRSYFGEPIAADLANPTLAAQIAEQNRTVAASELSDIPAAVPTQALAAAEVVVRHAA